MNGVEFLESFSTLWRPIDFRNRWNVAIVLLAGAVAVAGFGVFWLVLGEAVLTSILWAVVAAGGVFLAWACGRELDPDHYPPAFIAAAVALAGIAVFGLPDLVAVLWIIMAMRLVNRTVGLPATLLDSLAILALAGWQTLAGNWTAGLVSAVAFWADSTLPAPHKPSSRYAMAALALTLVLVIATRLAGVDFQRGRLLLPALLISLAAGGLFVLVIRAMPAPKAVGDRTDEPLELRRVQAGQAIALVAALSTALWLGNHGLVDLAPLWGGLVGVILYRGWRALRGSRR